MYKSICNAESVSHGDADDISSERWRFNRFVSCSLAALFVSAAILAAHPAYAVNSGAPMPEATRQITQNSPLTRPLPPIPPNFGGALDLSTAPAPAKPSTGGEIRFGMISPFTGANKDSGAQLKVGVDTGFAVANEAGGVNGKMVKLEVADDGYDPARTPDIAKHMVEKDKPLGFVSNFGSATAAAILPYVQENKLIFFAAFSGANLLRREPPDRYVFNYRPSYSEETDAAVRYLVKVRRLQLSQIAVFAQQDAFGDSGFEGVEKAVRALSESTSKPVLRLNYARNSIDVESAVAELRKHRNIKAVVMVATFRAAAKFIEKTRDIDPDLIYTNVSAVGSTALAEELTLLGPRFADGVIVTQVVPSPDGYSSLALEYKAALAKYFPSERPDYLSFESYVDAKILLEALKRAGPQPDSEKLVDAFENINNLDLGLGVPINFGPGDHQAVHKVWGTRLDAQGHFQPIELK